MIRCTSCGVMNSDNRDSCEKCGAKLSRGRVRPVPTPRPSQIGPEPTPLPEPLPISPVPSGALPMTLIVTDYGLEIPLPEEPEVIIGREDPASNIFPDIDTTTYGGNLYGVSRRHARIVLQGNQYFIEDLNSVNSTFVNKIKLAPRQRFPLNDGDELILGRLKFTVRIG